MLLFYYINLVKHKKNFDSPRLLECQIIWNGGSIVHMDILKQVRRCPLNCIWNTRIVFCKNFGVLKSVNNRCQNVSKITECQVDSSLLVFTQSSAFLYLINLFNEVRAMLILKKRLFFRVSLQFMYTKINSGKTKLKARTMCACLDDQ